MYLFLSYEGSVRRDNVALHGDSNQQHNNIKTQNFMRNLRI